MTIGSLHAVPVAYWGFAVRALDVIYALSLFGLAGALPPLLKVIAKCARYVMTRQ